MKLSVSLSEDDLAVLDEYMRASGLPSRSAAVQFAVRQLRRRDLQESYADAFAEWHASGDGEWWETVTGDGLDDAAR